MKPITLINRNNPKITKPLDLDEFVAFTTKNPMFSKQWEVVQTSENLLEGAIEPQFKESASQLLEYKKSLHSGQINEIESGYKEIRFNSEIGYFLFRIKENSPDGIKVSHSLNPLQNGGLTKEMSELKIKIFSAKNATEFKNLCEHGIGLFNI